MIRVYNKETGAKIWDGADDQVPQGVQVGDEISFVEDMYKIEEITGQGEDRNLFVRHLHRK